jgi:outer membrane protein
MKRLYQTLLLTLLIPLWTHAQQQDTTTGFSLEDCIKYALENTIDVKNARVDEQIAEAKVKETVGIGLPQIDGQVQVAHNQKLQRFFATYGTAQGFAGEDEVTKEPLLQLPGVAESDVVAMNSPFQLKSTGDAKLTITQLLFSGSYLVGLKASSTYKELAYKTTEQTKIELVEAVTKAYYSVLINNERIALFDNNIGRVDSLLRSTTAMNKNGFAEEIDVDRIRVSLNNLKTERIKFLNSQALSLALLKFQMNYPIGEVLQVRGSIQSLKIDESVLNEYQNGWDPKNRIEYKVLETQRQLQRLDVKNKYATGMPTLSAFANLGYSTQSPNVGGLFKTNTNIKDDGMIGPDKWYSYSMFGLTLNVPIFSGLQRNYQVQQSKLSMLKIENNITKLNRSIELGIEQNTIMFRNSLETLKSQEENMQLASKVARVTKIKYEQGVGSNIEVTDAESSLRESQVNYYNALFDAIVAKIDLDKTYGKINPDTYSTTTTTNQK